MSAAGEDDRIAPSGSRPSRPNAPPQVLPSIVVDASYLEAAWSIHTARKRSPAAWRRRMIAVTAVASLCGALAGSLVPEETEPESPTVTRMPVTVTVGAATLTPQAPAPASLDSVPGQGERMTQRAAAALVHRAGALRRVGETASSRDLLTDVLKQRPGYPPAFAAMAGLELQLGHATAGVRWARHAVRALPRSFENWQLLSQAYTFAGLHAESSRAHARATLLRQPTLSQ